MRRLLLGLLIFGALLLGGVAQATVSNVFHHSGQVTSVDEQKISIDGRLLYVVPHCVYERHTRRNGAYFVDKASPRNLHVGSNVTVRINGTVVDKIMIEEWKR